MTPELAEKIYQYLKEEELKFPMNWSVIQKLTKVDGTMCPPGLEIYAAHEGLMVYIVWIVNGHVQQVRCNSFYNF